MKKYFLKWASSLLALMMPWVTFAQTKGIYGKVVDEKGEPILFVNAVLISLPDSTIVHGTVTDEQGFFKMNTDVDLAVLQLSMLGYQTLCLPMESAAGQIIKMEEDMTMLGEAVVLILTQLVVSRFAIGSAVMEIGIEVDGQLACSTVVIHV